MDRKKVHENFHLNIKLQKDIVRPDNFTYKTIIEMLNEYFKKAKNILDIGCGVGTLDFYLASKGKCVYGVDISEKAINMAKENSKMLHLSKNIQFSVLDFPHETLNGLYDAVLISEVLEHLEDDKMGVKSIYRLLRTGAVVIASSPSNKAPLYGLGLLEDFDRRVGHVRRYGENEFRKLFEDNGFRVNRIIKTEGLLRNFLFTNDIAGNSIRFIRGPISSIITFFDNISLKIFGESQLILVAIKT